MRKLLTALWLVAWAALFITWGVVIDARDSDVVLFFGMVVLSFPSSLLLVGLLRTLAPFGFGFPEGVSGHYMGVGLFILLGYVQWFILIPWLIRGLRQAQPVAPADGVAFGATSLRKLRLRRRG